MILKEDLRTKKLSKDGCTDEQMESITAIPFEYVGGGGDKVQHRCFDDHHCDTWLSNAKTFVYTFRLGE